MYKVQVILILILENENKDEQIQIKKHISRNQDQYLTKLSATNKTDPHDPTTKDCTPGPWPFHKWLGAGYVHISNAGLQQYSHHCKGKLMWLSLSEVISNYQVNRNNVDSQTIDGKMERTASKSLTVHIYQTSSCYFIICGSKL